MKQYEESRKLEEVSDGKTVANVEEGTINKELKEKDKPKSLIDAFLRLLSLDDDDYDDDDYEDNDNDDDDERNELDETVMSFMVVLVVVLVLIVLSAIGIYNWGYLKGNKAGHNEAYANRQEEEFKYGFYSGGNVVIYQILLREHSLPKQISDGLQKELVEVLENPTPEKVEQFLNECEQAISAENFNLQ